MPRSDLRSQTAEVPPSLLSRSDALNARLNEVATSLEHLADTILGSAPHGASASGKEPSPVPSLARHIENAHTILNEIDGTLSRLASRVS